MSEVNLAALVEEIRTEARDRTEDGEDASVIRGWANTIAAHLRKATPPAAPVDLMLPRKLADGYRRRKNLGPEHNGRLVEMFQQMLIEARGAAAPDEAMVDGDELYRLLAQVGAVGEIDGYTVIRRASVLELVKRRSDAAFGARAGFQQRIQAAINKVHPPAGMTEGRAEHFKAGARAVIAAIDAALTGDKA